MIIYEFSASYEKIYVLVKVSILLLFIWKLVLLYRELRGRVKYLPLVVGFVLLLFLWAFIKSFFQVVSLQKSVQNAGFHTLNGTLDDVRVISPYRAFGDLYKNTTFYVEVINIDGFNLTRPSPKLYSRNIGCLNDSIYEQLLDELGNQIEVRYFVEYFDDGAILSPCIVFLKVVKADLDKD
ncbi:hypothetical protein [Enterovibrio norvegicus]|uniref:Uncharacterized protein n=1 Tax=Enterovibrio norvegicus TaxID=188144 RepID=A0A2N7LH79_9GAMM|nr:hypothetical protein [Enterovibrio norvegicus]PMN94904.1 hypothetical protein BCT23_02405 [Enterovibrio norvegicus]